MAKNVPTNNETHVAPAETDTPVETNQETETHNRVVVVEGNGISEEQSVILRNQELFSAANQGTDKPSFEEITKAWEDAVIDEDQLIEHVNNGDITKEQFAEIYKDFDELMKERNSPTAQMLSFEDAQKHLQKRMDESEGKLNAGGASALAEMMFQRKEISLQTKGQLFAWLAAMEGSNIGPNPGKMIADDILAHYKPTRKLEDAAANAADILQGVIKSSIEFEGTKAAMLVVDLADIAVLKLDAGELHVTFATTPVTIDGVTKQLRRCTMHRDLWAMIKKEELLGKVVKETVTFGKKVLDQGTTFDPYTDKAIVPIIDRLCMKACLIAYGRGEVQFGYAPKSRERVSRKQAFLPTVEDEGKYHKHVVMPANRLKPRIFKYETVSETYQTTRSGQPTTSERWVTKAVDAGPNPDTSLKWVPDECVDPIYQHVFADHELVYETVAKGDKEGGGVVPSGYVLRSYDPNVGDLRGRQRESSAEDKKTDAQKIADLTKERDTARVERDKAQGGISLEDRVKALQAIEGIMSNTKLPTSVAEQCHVILAAETLIKKRLNTKPEADVLKRLVALMRALDAIIVYDAADDKWEYHSPDGSLRAPIAA